MRWRHWVKPSKDHQQINGTEGESNPLQRTAITRYERFHRCDTNNFAIVIQQWPAAVSGIDSSVGLNPSSGFAFHRSESANDAFGDGVLESFAGRADCDHRAAKVDRTSFRQLKVRKSASFEFQQSDIESRVHVNYLRLKALAVRGCCA